MVSTISHNENITPTNYILNDCDDDCYTYTIEKTDCDDYEYIREEKEWIKIGWNNPHKILLPKKYFYKKININIRNRLLQKIRL